MTLNFYWIAGFIMWTEICFVWSHFQTSDSFWEKIRIVIEYQVLRSSNISGEKNYPIRRGCNYGVTWNFISIYALTLYESLVYRFHSERVSLNIRSEVFQLSNSDRSRFCTRQTKKKANILWCKPLLHLKFDSFYCWSSISVLPFKWHISCFPVARHERYSVVLRFCTQAGQIH